MKKVILALAATATTAAIACGTAGTKTWIVSGGDVSSDMGWSCSKEENPCTNAVNANTEEWLTATPKSGYDFLRWDYCNEAHGQYCKINHTEGNRGVVALFAPDSAIRVKVEACTSGILPGSLCTPYVGKELALIIQGDVFAAIGWDNRVYTGTYHDNMFSGSADGELMTAVDNGDGRISITLWPKGYSGCSSTVPNCVVSLKTVLQ